MDNETREEINKLSEQIKELRFFGETLQKENEELKNRLRDFDGEKIPDIEKRLDNLPIPLGGKGNNELLSKSLSISSTGLKVSQIGSITKTIKLNLGLAFDYEFNQTSFDPLTTSNYNLGSSTRRWLNIYLVNAPDVSSDIRFKKNIKPLKYGLKEVLKIKPISYTKNGKHLGFSAQDLKNIIPEIVSGKEELSIRPDEIIPVLVNAIKELNEKIKKLNI